jgi:ribosomal protein S18 acetylase RimI-like enzyme
MTDLQTVLIRPLTEQDLPALEWDGVYRSHRPVFRRTFEEMQQGQKVMLVAVDGDEMVGQIFVQLESSEARFANGQTRGYLYALRVRPSLQRQGIGTRLIAAGEEELRARGFKTAVISAGKENPGALRLYQRLGYRVFTEDPGVWYFTDVNGNQQCFQEPCWVLEKGLTDDG